MGSFVWNSSLSDEATLTNLPVAVTFRAWNIASLFTMIAGHYSKAHTTIANPMIVIKTCAHAPSVTTNKTNRISYLIEAANVSEIYKRHPQSMYKYYHNWEVFNIPKADRASFSPAFSTYHFPSCMASKAWMNFTSVWYLPWN